MAVMFIGLMGFCASSRAASLEDLRGEWVLLTKLSSGATLSEMHVDVNSAGDLAGFVRAMGAEAEITQFAMEGDSAVVFFSIARGQQSMDLSLKLKVDGDDATGFVKTGGQGLSLPVVGARVGSEGEMLIRMSLAEAEAKAAGRPTLRFAEAGDFAGEWDMTVESESAGTMTVPFIVSETGGMATALLKMEAPLGEQRINNITKTDSGLDMRYQISVANQEFKVVMRLAMNDGKITGQIADEGGVFSIPVSAVRKGQGDSVAASGASDSQRAALSGRAPRGRAGSKVARGTVAGRRLEIAYGELDTTSPGMNRVPFTQSEGYIWQPGKNGATKLKTSGSLDFGGKVIPPGRYGLWARRTREGWNLVVNGYPDVWGTQHDPSVDLAEVPMEITALETPAETIEFRITEENGGGVITIYYGDTGLAARFKAAD